MPLILSVAGGKHAEAILDKFTTLDEVTDAVRKAGLEGCGLIFGKCMPPYMRGHNNHDFYFIIFQPKHNIVSTQKNCFNWMRRFF